MDKKIVQYSYWLGLLCVVVAIAWRAGTSMGYWVQANPSTTGIGYMTFFKGAVLFLLVTMAASANLAANRQ